MAKDDELELPLDDSELDELHELLGARGDGDGLLLDAVHGFITVMVIGPTTIPPEEWLPTLVDDGRAFDSVDQAERTVHLIVRLYNAVRRDLDRFIYNPVLSETATESGERATSAHGWCEGFSLGVDMRADIWEARMRDDPALLAALSPIVQLSADEGVFGSDDGEEPPPLSEGEYESALNRLPGAVGDVQQYWRDYPPGTMLGSVRTAEAGSVPVTQRQRGGRSVH